MFLTVGAVTFIVSDSSRSVDVVGEDLADRGSRSIGEPGATRSVGTPGAGRVIGTPSDEVPEALAFAEPAQPSPTTTNRAEGNDVNPQPERETDSGGTGQVQAPGTTPQPSAAPTSTVGAIANTESNANPTDRGDSPPTRSPAPASTTPATTSAPRPSSPPPTTTQPTTTVAPRSGVLAVSVGTDGRANGAGFVDTPVHEALDRAAPGTVFEFAPGTHRPLQISGASGTSSAPIIVTAEDPNNPPVFSSGSYTDRAGISVANSSHTEISSVEVTHSLWGVRIDTSTGILVDRTNVTDIGQEGIRVLNGSNGVTISNSRITGTGNRRGTHSDGQPYSLFGEGIYLGTGQNNQDQVRNVRIIGNDISNTGTEAIDVKRPVRDVTISGNRIYDIETGTSGAIAVHIDKSWSDPSPNISIRNNTITDITTSTPYRDGNAIAVGSTVEITGNTIRNTEHYGIRIEDEGSVGAQMTVHVSNNTFSSTGSGPIWRSDGRSRLVENDNSGA